ncbi:hypothetical protein SNE40_014166 [Patella caerulea]|uniref:SGNH hydrolase-type esterase domain-containing protein n=1 Tax=Patella caerulea TaxID=87958 RepID=A0AAN8JHH5_PATCE
MLDLINCEEARELNIHVRESFNNAVRSNAKEDYSVPLCKNDSTLQPLSPNQSVKTTLTPRNCSTPYHSHNSSMMLTLVNNVTECETHLPLVYFTPVNIQLDTIHSGSYLDTSFGTGLNIKNTNNDSSDNEQTIAKELFIVEDPVDTCYTKDEYIASIEKLNCDMLLLADKIKTLDSEFQSIKTLLKNVSSQESFEPLVTEDHNLGPIHKKFSNVKKLEYKRNIVIGSSVLKAIKPNGLDKTKSTEVRTLSGATIQDVITYVDNCITSNNVRNVIFLIGSNDSKLKYGPYADYTRNYYRTLIELCFSKFPYASVKFIRLLPRFSRSSNIIINRINDILYDVCEDCGIDIPIDHGNLFYNYHLSKIRQNLYHDSVHLNSYGSTCLSKLIRKHIISPSMPN